MKKLVGGDYLLDLTPIEIEESVDGTTKTNITNKEIIEQLTNLKKFVSNPSMVKPVWIKLYNGETDEIVVVRGEFKVVDANEFEICAFINGYKLQLFIEFTQVELSDNTPIDDWYIATNDAKYLFTSDAQNVKATIEDADFGDVALAGDLSVGGDLSSTGDLSVGGDASVTGDLSVTGKINNVENPSVKPIYWHNVHVKRSGEATSLIEGDCVIVNNSSSPIDSSAFVNLLKTSGVVIPLIAGKFISAAAPTILLDAIRLAYDNETNFTIYFYEQNSINISSLSLPINSLTITDLGTNKIN